MTHKITFPANKHLVFIRRKLRQLLQCSYWSRVKAAQEPVLHPLLLVFSYSKELLLCLSFTCAGKAPKWRNEVSQSVVKPVICVSPRYPTVHPQNLQFATVTKEQYPSMSHPDSWCFSEFLCLSLQPHSANSSEFGIISMTKFSTQLRRIDLTDEKPTEKT